MASSTDVSSFVQLKPSQFISFPYKSLKTEFVVANSSPDKNVAFKIRTTMPLLFVVKPNSGIIEANSEARIDINYVPNDVSRQSIANPLFL